MEEVLLRIEGQTEKKVAKGTSFFDVVKSMGKAKEVIAVRVNGREKDLFAKAEEDAEVALLTFDSPEGKEIYRHSSAHLMAQAVKELFPSAKMTIGPAIEEGFYYDFDFERPFTPEDLQKIEEKMNEIIQRDLQVSRMELSREEAIRLFKERGEDYKVELIGEIEPPISAYQQGEFIDLCMGPHVPSPGRIKAIKLTSSAGAYWRGSEKNKMLQRIYGT
ncbi:MAG TPA: hypothetical protein VFA47_13050, partial [Candidatus Manganitrophaceae bacterium]|nr:hypothetical protein [Candidatus Manganitrophaceae bacterium]